MPLLTRRWFLALAAAAGATAVAPARASEFTPYSPDARAALDASGKRYLIEFWARWCVACRVQNEEIDLLLAAKPHYREVPILRVDWDEAVNGPLVAELAIPRRSTILVMQSGVELHRVVAKVAPEHLETLFLVATES